ncbi:MAG: lamin tail domain-containing protein [Patescibacteria group bacterium]|jgi:hypothetical protein
MHKNIFFVSLIVITVLMSQPISVQATPASHLVISEIKISGETGYSTDEFIELYNPTSETVSLDGYSLKKKTATGSEYDLVVSFGERSMLAGGYVLIAHPTGYRGTVTPDILYTTENSIATNNAVILYDGTGVVVDTVGFGTATVYEGAPASNPASTKSIERKALESSAADTLIEGGVDYFKGNGNDTDSNGNDFVVRVIPEPQNSTNDPEFETNVPSVSTTPSTTNSVTAPVSTPDSTSSQTLPLPVSPSPAPSSALTPTTLHEIDLSNDIRLSEVYPAPRESALKEEYIEITNTDQRTVFLDGWRLTDGKKKFVIPANTSIAPGDFLTFLFSQTKITLNNGGDTVFLQDPTGKVMQGVEYGQARYDNAFSYFTDQGWEWANPTPGQENVPHEENIVLTEAAAPASSEKLQRAEASSEIQLIPISDARKLASGDVAYIEGIVTVEPNLLGSKTFYMQDNSAGIKVVASFSIEDIHEGDDVKVKGKISLAEGGIKVSVADMNSIEVIDAREASVSDIAVSDVEAYPGQLVRVSGKVESIDGSTIIIADGAGHTASVYMKRTAKISKPSWDVGDDVVITGIVEKSNEGLRILPRKDDDFIKPEVQGVSTENIQSADDRIAQNTIEIGEEQSKKSSRVWYVLGGATVLCGAAIWAWYVQVYTKTRRTNV